MSASSSQPIKPFAWSKASTEAAVLLAEDRLTDQQIAATCGVAYRTFRRWKKHPEFQARISELLEDLQERARRRGLGRLDRRKAAAEDRHRRMSALIDARAEAGGKGAGAEAGGKGAGAETGLLVRSSKIVSSGDGSYVVEEWAFDHHLMRELRELEKQIAQDTGQWSEKREVSGPGGASLVIQMIERQDGPA